MARVHVLATRSCEVVRSPGGGEKLEQLTMVKGRGRGYENTQGNVSEGRGKVEGVIEVA